MKKQIFLFCVLLFSTGFTLNTDCAEARYLTQNEVISQKKELQELFYQKSYRLEQEVRALELIKNAITQSSQLPLLDEKSIEELIAGCPQEIHEMIRDYNKARSGELNQKLSAMLIKSPYLLYGNEGVATSEVAKAIALSLKLPFMLVECTHSIDQCSVVLLALREIEKNNFENESSVLILDRIDCLNERDLSDMCILIDECNKTKKVIVIATACDITSFPKTLQTRFNIHSAELKSPEKLKMLRLYFDQELKSGELDQEKLECMYNEFEKIPCDLAKFAQYFKKLLSRKELSILDTQRWTDNFLVEYDYLKESKEKITRREKIFYSVLMGCITGLVANFICDVYFKKDKKNKKNASRSAEVSNKIITKLYRAQYAIN